MRDDSSVERFLGNDNDKIGFHFDVTFSGTYKLPLKFSKISLKIPIFPHFSKVFSSHKILIFALSCF